MSDPWEEMKNNLRELTRQRDEQVRLQARAMELYQADLAEQKAQRAERERQRMANKRTKGIKPIPLCRDAGDLDEIS